MQQIYSLSVSGSLFGATSCYGLTGEDNASHELTYCGSTTLIAGPFSLNVGPLAINVGPRLFLFPFIVVEFWGQYIYPLKVNQTFYGLDMARIARVIAVGYPHHITQRGDRRQKTFFCDEDYIAYIELMAQWCQRYKVEIWAWCLMPNHVHLIAVPQNQEGLGRAVG